MQIQEQEPSQLSAHVTFEGMFIHPKQKQHKNNCLEKLILHYYGINSFILNPVNSAGVSLESNNAPIWCMSFCGTATRPKGIPRATSSGGFFRGFLVPLAE
jgi:hypothetical protein